MVLQFYRVIETRDSLLVEHARTFLYLIYESGIAHSTNQLYQ